MLTPLRLAQPIFVRCFLAGTLSEWGVSFATGMLRRQITMVAPSSASSTKLEKRVLASATLQVFMVKKVVGKVVMSTGAVFFENFDSEFAVQAPRIDLRLVLGLRGFIGAGRFARR